MNGARFVHDRARAGGLAGRDRRCADGDGLAPLACKTDPDRPPTHRRPLSGAPRSNRSASARSVMSGSRARADATLCRACGGADHASASVAAKTTTIPCTSRCVYYQGYDASRAPPARGRRKLPPAPANPRNAKVRKPRLRRESPPIPAQAGGAMTGLLRRRSRVRVSSLPYLEVPSPHAITSPATDAIPSPPPQPTALQRQLLDLLVIPPAPTQAIASIDPDAHDRGT
jgi:hypothetical protein